jgi:alpha-tubulin suppressor-like RCC1 family protein
MRRVTAISAGPNHTVALTVGGALQAFGLNKHGALGLGDTRNRALPTLVRPSASLEQRQQHFLVHLEAPACMATAVIVT